MTITLAQSLPAFQNEAGIHTVQRVPPTEKRGRVHTSTVCVAVLEEARPVFQVAENEIEIRFHRSTGSGGQRKNKVATCCVATHLPTGLTQKADGRSRLQNEELARSLLIKSLQEQSGAAASAATNKIRTTQISLHADRRRTYRFRDDLVIDHATGKKTTTKRFMRGVLEDVWPD